MSTYIDSMNKYLDIVITFKDSCRSTNGNWCITYHKQPINISAKIAHSYHLDVDEFKQAFNMDEIESWKIDQNYQLTNNLVEEF